MPFSIVENQQGLTVYRCDFFWSLMQAEAYPGDEIAAEFVLLEGASILVGRVPMRQDLWDCLTKAGYETWDQSLNNVAQIPVTGVSWTSVQMFLESLPLPFRLPTEAEWDAMCASGEGFLEPRPGLMGVPNGAPNAAGIYDLRGHLWQWCEDAWSAEEPYLRVLRGGSYRSADDARSYAGWQSHADDVGFRLVIDATVLDSKA